MKPSHSSEDDPEIAELMKESEKIDRELEAELVKFEKTHGVSYKDIEMLLADPENFPPEEWAELEKAREAFYLEMETRIGKETVAEIRTMIEQGTKERKSKSKSRATRNKWINTK